MDILVIDHLLVFLLMAVSVILAAMMILKKRIWGWACIYWCLSALRHILQFIFQ